MGSDISRGACGITRHLELAMSRRKRSALDLSLTLSNLKTGRSGAIAVMASTKPFGDRYRLAQAVTKAIDDLVEDVTGDRELFWTKPHG